MGTMGCIMERKLKVLPSQCDGASQLSIPAALDLFQDTATLHADHFDIGPAGMEKRNSFWIIYKTRLHINRMPHMMDDISAVTWIQPTERASCERDFAVMRGGEVMFYTRSIWAIISRETGRLIDLRGLYPEIEFTEAPPDDRPFVRIGKKFENAEVIGSYTIRSVDIDLGGHMNNVNYIRAMLGCFSTDELAQMDIHEIEMNYISQSYEGGTLQFLMQRTDSGRVIGAATPDGKIIFTALIL